MINLTLYFLLMAAVYFDFRFRRIPNKITLTSSIVGVLFWTIKDGLSGLTFCFLGLSIGFLVFLVPYILGGMGAGDVKLMMAVGALIGWKLTLLSSILTAIVGGFFALSYIIFTKSGASTKSNLYEILVNPLLKLGYRITGYQKFISWQVVTHQITENKTRNYIPYAIPIAIGTILALSGLFQGIFNF